MEKEKRKVDDLEDEDGVSDWVIIAQWLFVLLIIAAIVVYTLVILGPVIGNVFSDAIDCACLQ